VIERERTRVHFRGEVAKYGEKFKGFEEVRDFLLIAEDFTTQNDMLTPSLKLKRRAVIERYGAMIDALYKKRASESKKGASATV
jgi:long-chain acyl-CoA synthetase